VKPNNAIRSYANNDYWHDDASDGPVTAQVVLRNGLSVPVKASAWVLVTPPDFAPGTDNLVTLYDVLRAVAVGQNWLQEPADVSFTRDVYPIFARLVSYQWVSAKALIGHGPGQPGNLTDALALLDPNTSHGLADNSAASKPLRQHVFARLRNPLPANDAEATAQANLFYMPQLSGDDGDITQGFPKTWFSVLPSQYDKLRRWADGDFVADWPGSPPAAPALADIPLPDLPAALDRAALEHGVGGPFFPGIEMTYISRDPTLYSEPFRLRSNLEPGDVTRWMAVPWQADFNQCVDHWWPAQRPDDVITGRQYQTVLQAFGSVLADPNTSAMDLFFDRDAWSRGIDKGVVVPQPDLPRLPGETDDAYNQRVQQEWDRRKSLAGDDGMVEHWSDLGFVAGEDLPNGQTVFVESGRPDYFGLQDRDCFYLMLNLDAFPEFLPTAKVLARDFLDQAWALQSDPGFESDLTFFPYSPEALDARLDQIYNDLAQGVESYSPADDPLFQSREDLVERIRQFAPFNQLDGAWLRNITQAGPINDVHSLLFSIWMDEQGDGAPEFNHSNLYTDLLHSVGIYLDDVTTLAYANDENMLDSAYTLPLFELVISQFSQEFFPELLGMTLMLEWEVLELKVTIKLFEYFGINPEFYRMHVGIDNAITGHGGRAKKAVHTYLDQVRAASGEAEVQKQWERIWNGYVAFRTTGNLGQDLADKLQAPRNVDPLTWLQQQVENMIATKAPYARLNHDDKQIGGNLLNDWFTDPSQYDDFLTALQKAGLFVPGDPDNSPFFDLLEFTGPMYKVFTDAEIKLWRDWVRALGTGQQPQPDDPDAAQAMVQLIQAMQFRQLSTTGQTGHGQHQLTGPDPNNPQQTVTQPVAWWFQQAPASFMQALVNDPTGWVVTGDAAHSRFVTELLSGDHPMAIALRDIIPGSPHRRWNAVVVDWINKGCPMPAAPAAPAIVKPAAAKPVSTAGSLARRAPHAALGLPSAATADGSVSGIIPRLRLASSRDMVAHTQRRILGNGAIH
jgi:hypothetical protein